VRRISIERDLVIKSFGGWRRVPGIQKSLSFYSIEPGFGRSPILSSYVHKKGIPFVNQVNG
jgi:hypothetical protein